MASIDFYVEFGLYGGLYTRLPGASWRATMIDRATGQRYAGSDDSPWVAIAFAVYEAELRRGGDHAMARKPTDRPDQLLAELRARRAA